MVEGRRKRAVAHLGLGERVVELEAVELAALVGVEFLEDGGSELREQRARARNRSEKGREKDAKVWKGIEGRGRAWEAGDVTCMRRSRSSTVMACSGVTCAILLTCNGYASKGGVGVRYGEMDGVACAVLLTVMRLCSRTGSQNL